MSKTLENLMTDVVEQGYCDYWGYVDVVVRNSDNDVVEFNIYESDEPYKGGTITREKLLEARRKLLDGEIEIHASWAAWLIGKEEDWDYDATTADFLIQAAAFGEIRYS